jgi:D-amino-acid dehydrogenase
VRGDLFVLATGIESAALGRQVGVNIPVYPMRGNIVTIPLKVGFRKINFSHLNM